MANNQGRAPTIAVSLKSHYQWKQATNHQTSQKINSETEEHEGLDKILFISEGMEGCANPQSCAQAQERLEKALASYVLQLSMRT